MKGIILAGGLGTRLYPLTKSISKQILPVYDKPMIYYPLSVLMLAGIKEILIISTPRDLPMYEDLLQDGSQLGIKLSYEIQNKPKGLAQAFILGEEFIGNDSVSLILGDNIFYGFDFINKIEKASHLRDGALIFGYEVDSPREFGVVEFDENYRVVSIEEKPKNPKSNYIVPGLYFYDNNVIEIAKNINPSERGELEITSINNEYLAKGKLSVELLSKDTIWLDTGNYNALRKASNLVYKMQTEKNINIGCIEEVAYNKGYINGDKLIKLAESYKKTSYYNQLLKLISNK
ncbi:glucose-1-phosphate thymidylyltransferase RfbA [Romboutsia sp. Marseille-P6047]|uniref:glucose-1-phosphate thymidylyltransferase RfbA n=1 Tax=Romboutsia sp. Marseille-P6047 TaxID=2161817 RepID=UPI00082229C3|nr:glucose-1-phosphate thymidylyltransferase RfbA [Romboutsia sp. Marseille-P6047]SCI26514.1 Glucose-1-phosphate thymidylyltransferase [uncultured Clostridium sp.]